jgi:hypothetical protein
MAATLPFTGKYNRGAVVQPPTAAQATPAASIVFVTAGWSLNPQEIHAKAARHSVSVRMEAIDRAMDTKNEPRRENNSAGYSSICGAAYTSTIRSESDTLPSKRGIHLLTKGGRN